MRKNITVFLQVFAFSLLTISCSSEDSPQGIDPVRDFTDKHQEVRAAMESTGMNMHFQRSVSFSGSDDVFAPCSKKLLNGIKKAKKISDKMLVLSKDNKEAIKKSALENPGTTTEDAWENFEDQRKNILDYSRDLNEYCRKDYEVVSSCLGKEAVMVYLGKFTVDYPLVSPVVAITNLKQISQRGSKFVGLRRFYKQPSHYSMYFVEVLRETAYSVSLSREASKYYNSQISQIKSKYDCLKTNGVQSILGERILEFTKASSEYRP